MIQIEDTHDITRYPQITDELLSAYIDNQVTDDDKALIETAIAEDPLLAWQLDSLRYTVDLLHTLPQLALPRSFVLSDAQLVDGAVSMPALAEPTRMHSARRAPQPITEPGGFWMGWRNFWQMGNLFLRNAAAASLAVFLVISAGSVLLESTLRPLTGSPPMLLLGAPTAIHQPVPTTSALATSNEQAIAMVQTTTMQAAAGSELSTPLAKQAQEEAARAVDNSVAPTAVTPSPTANGAQAAADAQALHAQGVATDIVGGQGGDAAIPSNISRGEQSATPPSDRPDNQDFVPSEPEGLSSPLATIADTAVASNERLSPAHSVFVAAPHAAESVTSTGVVTVSAAISSSTVVSLTELAIISVPVTSSLPIETDTFSQSLLYSKTLVEAANLPPGDPTAARAEPRIDSNATTNTPSLLQIFQLASALAALLLGILWWLSRAPSPEIH